MGVVAGGVGYVDNALEGAAAETAWRGGGGGEKRNIVIVSVV